MKKFYLLLVVLMGFGSVSGQNPDDIIVFNDINFKIRLLFSQYSTNIALNLNGQITSIDSNGDSEIQVSEAQNISRLNLSENPSSLYTATQLTDLTGLSYFINLQTLNITSKFLTQIDLSPFPNLKHLYLSSSQQGPMQLSLLNIEGLQNLETIEIYQAPLLTGIDVNDLLYLETFKYTFPNLTTTGGFTALDLSQNPSLTSVELKYTQIASLNLSECPQLLTLTSSRSQITNVNLTGSQNIEHLGMSYCPIASLDISNLLNLKTLSVPYTLLQELSTTNNPMLYQIDCNHSNLNTLDVSNSPLITHIYCNNNNLTTLNVSNNPALTALDCTYNQLTTLNLMNAGSSSMSVYASNNPLESLLLKNGHYDQIFINYIPNLSYICADEFEITSLQNTISNYGYTTEINSYCSFAPGGDFYTINGSTTFDANNNGCDATDTNLSSLKFNITGGSQAGSFAVNQSENYSIPLSPGIHTVTPIIENPTFFTVTPPTLSVDFPTTTSPFTQNFCITPNGNHPDLEVTIVPTNPARPGFNSYYKLIIKNKGNIQQSGSVTFTYNDAILDYVSANPLATTQSTGTMTWDFANLQPFETRTISLTLNVNSPMETPAVNGGDVLNYTATITSAGTDDMPLDNTFSLPQIVVNSFDPNDKTCLEGTSITPDMIGKYVHYMIRFENTGTFPAQNIVVKDMIDATKFDVASLVPLNASHDYVTRITGNKVEFIFENINLPFDDATNDGYIVFKIKTVPTLVLGDSFSNTASIYFDYNFPIVTDPAVTTFAVLSSDDFVFNNYFMVYPNPAKDILNITSKQSIELKSMEGYNILGQLVLSIPNANGVDKVDVSNLNAGTYFLKVSSDKGTSNTKFIKN